MSTKMNETKRIPPWSTGKLRALIASTSQVPMPGQAKTVSVNTAPERSRPACRPTIVTLVDDARREPFCSGSANVVLVLHVEHRRAGDPRSDRQRDRAKGDRRQDH